MLRDLLEGSHDPRVEPGSGRAETIIGWGFLVILCLVSVFAFYVLFQK